jgi:LuxR family transcriptional regulator
LPSRQEKLDRGRWTGIVAAMTARTAMNPAPPVDPPSAAEALSLVRALLAAPDVATCWQMLCAAMRRAGFDRLNYAYAPALHDPMRASLSPRATLSSHPDPEVSEVYDTPILDRSPMRRWAAENVGAISWSRQPELLRRYGLEADGPALNALLGRLGFHAGYTIGFPPSEGGKAALGLTAFPALDQAQVDAIWAAHGSVLETLAGAAHARLTQLPLRLPGAGLTERQRMILGWIADGKSVQDVAILMDRSVAAIEKQLRETRNRLGVETTAQAVSRVAQLNQLPVPGRR